MREEIENIQGVVADLNMGRPAEVYSEPDLGMRDMQPPSQMRHPTDPAGKGTGAPTLSGIGGDKKTWGWGGG